mgnify:CR=1 FL=1
MEELMKLLKIEDETIKRRIESLRRSGMDVELLKKLLREEGSLSSLLKGKGNINRFELPTKLSLAEIALHAYYKADGVAANEIDEADVEDLGDMLDKDYPHQDLVASYRINGNVIYFEPKEQQGWEDWKKEGMPPLDIYAKRADGEPDGDSFNAVKDIALHIGYNISNLPGMSENGKYAAKIIYYVANKEGIHARPATTMSRILAGHCSGEIKLRYNKDGAGGNARSVIDILACGLEEGTTFTLYFEINPEESLLKQLEKEVGLKRIS